MATLHKEVFIAARPEEVWAAIRGVGALHPRLVPASFATRASISAMQDQGLATIKETLAAAADQR